APVGAHRDLLAYLVRRLLENGANSSFVNQIVDTKVPPEAVARDPFDAQPGALPKPRDLFGATRRNSTGFDLSDDVTLAAIEAARATGPAGPPPSLSPDQALASAQPWRAPVALRAQVLRRAADLYEHHQGQIFATLAREAGKTLPDCVGELREAVDFLRYYASCAEARDPNALGTMTAISPWNFPLAIFTGQIAAALACGNAVLAKPAEQTPRIAGLAVSLLHQAGVPTSALQLVPGDGSVGADLTGDPRVDGVVFTGSTETAHKIRQTMADHLDPGAPLVAETGGLNAMIIDSTALPEQAVRDVIASAFQSAGQRCSALRCLYVQD
ncbi:MAG: proline dehydrogenase family protein, partial [Pseudomonadota bacterium]